MNKLIFVGVALSLLPACKSTHDQQIGTVGDTMAYDTTMFAVRVGERVHLTLRNNGTSATMHPNWVLVQPGHEADVATAGMTAGKSANFVRAEDSNVIASTPLSAPGGSVDVTFIAPAAGKYPYISTYPGQYMTMKGVLEVIP